MKSHVSELLVKLSTVSGAGLMNELWWSLFLVCHLLWDQGGSVGKAIHRAQLALGTLMDVTCLTQLLAYLPVLVLTHGKQVP